MTNAYFLFGIFVDVTIQFILGIADLFTSKKRIYNGWKGVKVQSTVYPTEKIPVIGPRHQEMLDAYNKHPKRTNPLIERVKAEKGKVKHPTSIRHDVAFIKRHNEALR